MDLRAIRMMSARPAFRQADFGQSRGESEGSKWTIRDHGGAAAAS
jgi:hypothetical protein